MCLDHDPKNEIEGDTLEKNSFLGKQKLNPATYTEENNKLLWPSSRHLLIHTLDERLSLKRSPYLTGTKGRTF